jgi:hypothetical protein
MWHEIEDHTPLQKFSEIRITRNEAELALTYLVAESLSHRPVGIRNTLTTQWQELIDPAAWSEFQNR